MAETYHIEFRYGRDLEELQGYLVGPYAYWLSAGIDAEADADTIEDVIALFCLENMDCTSHTEESLAQLEALGFVGSWDADLSAYGEAYAGITLHMSIDENGHGVTYMNGMQTADFEAFALDNGEAGDGDGLYVAYSNYEYEAEAAPYTMEENEDGAAVLTFYADDGTISWVKAEAVEFAGLGTAEDPYQIETAAQQTILDTLPEDIRDEFAPLICPDETDELYKLVKAADKLSALIKCTEEKNSGNKEFLSAEKATLKAIKKLSCPEAEIFLEEFMGSYSMVLDTILK